MEDYLKELETQNSRTEIEVTQLKNELAQLRTQAPAAIRSMEDYLKELETQNSRTEIEVTQLKNELAQLRTQAPAAPFQTVPVREWKRKACEESRWRNKAG